MFQCVEAPSSGFLKQTNKQTSKIVLRPFAIHHAPKQGLEKMCEYATLYGTSALTFTKIQGSSGELLVGA